MTYRQNDVPRRCEICLLGIKKDEWILDLFRQESASEGSTVRVCWVHENCARQAIQKWLLKKWGANETTSQ